jgi:hypothetical protein
MNRKGSVRGLSSGFAIVVFGHARPGLHRHRAHHLETREVRYIGTETFDGGTGRFNNATGTSGLTGTASIFTGTGLYTVQGRSAY